MTSPSKRRPAEGRGEMQMGFTRDKTPGFDPSAAPQETDAEAGGSTSSAHRVASDEPKFTNQASFADAMQRPQNAPGLQPSRNGPVLVIAALVVLAGAAFLLAARLG
ncbi:hypothetical protein [Mesorhizobium sp. WSM3868]|uniref:hypothetical protein n=1 Tax=Mesorhizobium sp. WSM3868 TaxID=2029405 RepID=UPI000BB0B7FB|nr:hypothetical protein [Mesorhizobium sp. WSM3868]PBB33086.1 hypothetical protein CK221_23810 [Mesorhizobium sp. WSM3868]